MLNISNLDCFVRLNLSKPQGGFFLSGSVELFGKKSDISIGDTLNIGGLRFYVTNIIYKQQTTLISIVSDGKKLQNLKLPIGFKYITLNEGVLYYMSIQNIEKPPYSLMYINSSKSPWSDNNHFDAVSILNNTIQVVNYQYGTNYRIKSNFSYGVKDLQINRGSDVISAIKSVFPFTPNIFNTFVYNNTIHLNFLPNLNVDIESIFDDICLTSLSQDKEASGSEIVLTGLAGRTGNWKTYTKNEDCVLYTAVRDSYTNKEYIHSKLKEVSLSGTITDMRPYGDLVSQGMCKYQSSLDETDENIQIEINNELLTSGNDDDVFSRLTKLATYFQKAVNETSKTVKTINKYTYLPDFPPDIYERGVVSGICSTQIIESPLLSILLQDGKCRRVRETNYIYNVYGNAAIKIGESIVTKADVIVIPNYNTEFYSDNTLSWNATSKVRYVDLSNIKQQDIEDILLTIFFKSLSDPVDIFKLLAMDYKQYINNLIINDEIDTMKDHFIVQEIINKNLPKEVSHFYQKAINVIKRTFKFLQDQYIPPVLAIYWAEKDQNGFKKDDFENSIKNNPYYKLLAEIISGVDYSIMELVPISTRVIQYKSLSGKKATKHTIDISLSPTGFYRSINNSETVDFRSLFTLVKPLSIGSVVITGKIHRGNNTQRQPVDIPTSLSIKLPTNNPGTLISIFNRISNFLSNSKIRSRTYIIPAKNLSNIEVLTGILNELIFSTISFNLSIDNRSGLANLSYTALIHS